MDAEQLETKSHTHTHTEQLKTLRELDVLLSAQVRMGVCVSGGKGGGSERESERARERESARLCLSIYSDVTIYIVTHSAQTQQN